MKMTELEKEIVAVANEEAGIRLRYVGTSVFGDLAAITMLDRHGNRWAAVGDNDVEKEVWEFSLMTAPDGDLVRFDDDREPVDSTFVVAECFVVNVELSV